MKFQRLVPLLIAIAAAGCASHQKPGLGAEQAAGTVAVIPFSSPSSPIAGQETADAFALKLLKKGYMVLDRTRTATILDEKKFYETGFTDEMGSRLRDQQVNALLYGQVSEFSCNSRQRSLFFGNATPQNRCSVAVSVKMADAATGKLLWGMMLKDTAEGENLTALDLLRSMIGKSDSGETIPLAKALALPAASPAPPQPAPPQPGTEHLPPPDQSR